MGRTAVSDVKSSPGFVNRRAPLEVQVKIPLGRQVEASDRCDKDKGKIHTRMKKRALRIVDLPSV